MEYLLLLLWYVCKTFEGFFYIRQTYIFWNKISFFKFYDFIVKHFHEHRDNTAQVCESL